MKAKQQTKKTEPKVTITADGITIDPGSYVPFKVSRQELELFLASSIHLEKMKGKSGS